MSGKKSKKLRKEMRARADLAYAQMAAKERRVARAYKTLTVIVAVFAAGSVLSNVFLWIMR